MPKAIQIGPYAITVVNSTNLANELECDAALGLGLQQLVVREGYSRDYTAVSILHEVLHGVWRLAGLHHDLGDHEERIVSSMDAALLDTLRRNPELVAYLIGDDT
jgi:hypothetical protein